MDALNHLVLLVETLENGLVLFIGSGLFGFDLSHFTFKGEDVLHYFITPASALNSPAATSR